MLFSLKQAYPRSSNGVSDTFQMIATQHYAYNGLTEEEQRRYKDHEVQ